MASSDRIVKYAEVATNGFQDAGRQMNDLGQQLETITQGLQGALNKASGFSQIMNDSATQLRAASQNMQPTLDAFARQTALAADQLSQTANKLNRASAPQHAGWRPEQWLVIGLGLTMMGGILIALVMQTLHLF
jgi:methyl-accepting chemotaxis protein